MLLYKHNVSTEQDNEIETKPKNGFRNAETMAWPCSPPLSTFMKSATFPSTIGTLLLIDVNSDNNGDGHPQSQSQDEVFN